jgi:hypothetical protein
MKAMMRVLRACLSEHAIEGTEVEKRKIARVISTIAEFCRRIGGTVEDISKENRTGVSCILPYAKPLDFLYDLERLRIRSGWDRVEEELYLGNMRIHIDAKTPRMSSSVWSHGSDLTAHVYGDFKIFEVIAENNGTLHIYLVGFEV